MRTFKKRICAYPECSAEFTPTQTTNRFCGKVHQTACKKCNQPVYGRTLKEWKALCSTCRKEEAKVKRRKTAEAKYGVEHISQLDQIKEKKIQTSLKNYGVINVSQSPEVKEKKKNTSVKNYKVENPSQSAEIKEKKKETVLLHYGVDNPMKDPFIKEKMRKTSEDKNGGIGWSSPKISQAIRKTQEKLYGGIGMGGEKTKKKITATNQARYGFPYVVQAPSIKDKISKSLERNYASGISFHQKISKMNLRWAEKIEKLALGDIILEPYLGNGMSGDIQIGKLILDFNPTFTHNSYRGFGCVKNRCEEFPCPLHSVSKSRHFERAQYSLFEDISYLQFYDWDDEISVLSLLRGKLAPATKYSARKLKLVKLTSRQASDFLRVSHIQGTVRGQIHCYGLSLDDKLLAVATFGLSRFGSRTSYEWLRYAVADGYIIQGGAGRLWLNFLKEVQPESVVSYVDFNHTTRENTFFSSIPGWEELKPTGPSKLWSKGARRIYDNSLRSLGADRLLKTNYGSQEESGLNNEQIMLLEGWLPVYTAGNRVFQWKNNNFFKN